ncbi:hypothetical protein VitviT2T_028131 [Vitis vinifera]|uniref:Integrase catalytic domain-containing protein n=1 Tax=Vitis vinifera TaxID=29760 RepID=A0ABY9DTU4_VITVI|nr:hypothetical protein VitviT2T_028131 [Vitis vinifera]
MPAPRTETEIRGFLGRLQYIIRFIDRLTDTCEPIFRLLRKNQPIVWNDDCQRTFKKIKECLLFPLVLVPPTPGRPLLLYLSISDMALGCILAQLNDSGKVRAIYYLSKRMLEYECRYIMIERLYLALVWVTRRLRHYVTEYSILLVSRLDPLRYLFDRPILTDHLASLPVSDDRPIDDDFPDEQFVSVTSIVGWRLFRDYARPWSQTVGDPRGFQLGYSVDSRAENQFADALATLAFVIEIPAGVTVRPLLIETRSTPAYCCLIGDIEDQDELPWYHDIYQFLLCGVYPESASTKDRRALRQLATRFMIFGDSLYKRSLEGLLLLCLDRASIDRVMREVHAGVCGPHMGGHMFARKIMRTDCCQFVQRCPFTCQMHGDLIHVPPSELHALTSLWPFSVWGIDVIGKISPKSSNGHEYILVVVDYFNKWVETASYARLTVAKVATFTRGEVDTLIREYDIQHHRSSTYRPQTNGVVEAANKNIKRILRKMVDFSGLVREALFCIMGLPYIFLYFYRATLYSLVYGMEVALPVKIEMGSLRVALEQQIFETEWAQSRYDQLSLLDERRLRAVNHVQAYQRKMTLAFRKRVKPRKFQKGDLVLKVLRRLISDPRGKFRPTWSGPYVIRDLTREGAAWLMDLDRNQFTEPDNVDR